MDKNLFEKLKLNLQKMQSLDGQVVIIDGQRVGTGAKTSHNMIKKTTVSKNEVEARIQEKYEKSVKGTLMQGEANEAEIEGIVDKHVENLVKELFEGL